MVTHLADHSIDEKGMGMNFDYGLQNYSVYLEQ